MGTRQMNVLASMDCTSRIKGPAALTLDQSGVIQDCTETIEELFGLSRTELVLHHISQLFPQLLELSLLSNGRLNSRLIYLAHCGHLFRAQIRDGGEFFGELFFSQVGDGVSPILRVIVRPSGGTNTSNV